MSGRKSPLPPPQASCQAGRGTLRARLATSSVLAIFVLFVLAIGIYSGALRNPPVFDDRVLREDFLKHYASAWFSLDLRWFSYASFGWIYQVFGKDWFWQRLVNVCLHGCVATVLWLFLARLFELVIPRADADRQFRSLAPRWLAFFGAALFLLHPVGVYAVAYLVQRSMLLATLFGLISLRCFLEGLHRNSSKWLLAAVAAYFVAAYSKEHAVMLPAVALALALLMRAPLRPFRQLWLPLALFAGIAMLVAFKAKGVLGTPYEPFVQELLPRLYESRSTHDAAQSYLLSVLNQALLFFRYLLIWLLPYTGWMSIDLRMPLPTRLFQWPQAAAFAAYMAYPLLGLWLLRRGGRPGLVGFAALSPWLLALTEMATVRVQEAFVLYRSYLWMALPVGVLPVLVSRVPRTWALAVLAGACVVLVPLLLDRLDTFSSSITLWSDAIRKQPTGGAPYVERAHHNRGFAYLQARRHEEAMRDFNRALELNPRDANAYVGRGTLLTRTGRHVAALKELAHAIEIDPRYAEAYAKRCFVSMMLERADQAVTDCERAVALDPSHRDAHTNLGVVYAALARYRDAEASYQRALAIDPRNGDANLNYGVLMAVTGRAPEARRPLEIACAARIAAACDLLARLARKP
jgi:tetratricopeptide (TPR) repeat protein